MNSSQCSRQEHIRTDTRSSTKVTPPSGVVVSYKSFPSFKKETLKIEITLSFSFLKKGRFQIKLSLSGYRRKLLAIVKLFIFSMFQIRICQPSSSLTANMSEKWRHSLKNCLSTQHFGRRQAQKAGACYLKDPASS